MRYVRERISDTVIGLVWLAAIIYVFVDNKNKTEHPPKGFKTSLP